jgi:dolichyl-diphosphooligosaccharide--protein glycosyltransferase
MTKENFATLTKTIAICVATVISGGVAVMTLSGKVAPWTGRFYSLLDPSYAKNNIPIIASVSEHQPTAWSSFYFDLQVSSIFGNFPTHVHLAFDQYIILVHLHDLLCHFVSDSHIPISCWPLLLL